MSYIKDQPQASSVSAGDFFVFDTATGTFKISRQALLGQMDLNKNNIATNASSISAVVDLAIDNKDTIDSIAPTVTSNVNRLATLEAQNNAGYIWQGPSIGSQTNMFSKMGSITLDHQYAEYVMNLQLIVKRGGQDYSENIFIGARQSSPTGSNPFMELAQRRFSSSAFTLGYVVESNSGPVVISIWVKYLENHCFPSFWVASKVASGASFAIEANPELIEEEPAGIEYATKYQIQTV